MFDELIDSRYGPVRYRTCREKVAEYVHATGDDPVRWIDHAPPSIAGALLFTVTPLLLNDERIADVTRSVIHGDQTFVWHGPFPVETDLEVSGRLTKARERSGVVFAGFDMSVVQGDTVILEGSSTFLMSAGAATGGSEPEFEPAPLVGSHLEPPALAPLPPAGGRLPELVRAVSRADLVRYAAASRDFNPIHWDHEAAVAAGLSGVVVHGLLQSAWLVQAAARHAPGPAPLAEARFRYRAPMRPGVRAAVTGAHKDGGLLEVSLAHDQTTFVTAAMKLAG